MSKKIDLPILNPNLDDPAPAAAAAPVAEVGPDAPKTRAEGGTVMSEIEREVTTNRVYLYMKGTPMMPMCGFSARVAQILQHVGVPYASTNILEDPEKRVAIKEYTDWPTIPQLYVDGEFVGGCDIVTEMFQTGELQQLLGAE